MPFAYDLFVNTESAKTILETEPYRIIREVKGIGFKTADKIALNLDFQAMARQELKREFFTLQESEDDGHTHIERRALALDSAQLLDADANEVENRSKRFLKKES